MANGITARDLLALFCFRPSTLQRIAAIGFDLPYEVIGNCFPNWLRFTDGLICCPSQQWDAHVQYSPRLTAMDASSAIARGRDGRLNTGLIPPSCFIATAMHLAMMTTAERDSELIADFAAQSR